jgi:hypothetical protein
MRAIEATRVSRMVFIVKGMVWNQQATNRSLNKQSLKREYVTFYRTVETTSFVTIWHASIQCQNRLSVFVKNLLGMHPSDLHGAGLKRSISNTTLLQRSKLPL